jgi:two-component system, OmpR family, response regulator MprA
VTIRRAGAFLARVRSRLRQAGAAGDDELRFADLTLDLRSHEVRRGARRIDVTPTEFNLLELFLRNPERIVTRHELFTEVWGFDFGRSSNALNVYIGYLRRKTEAAGEPRLLHTVRGVGYVLRKSYGDS